MTNRLRRLSLLFGTLLVPWRALAGTELPPGCTPPPDDATLEAEGATIGEITIVVDDVFDPSRPGENHFLYRLANRLHINTRPTVVEQLLLVKPGDPYRRRLLDESERLLRAESVFSEATIRPVASCGNTVHLVVEAHDVWTLFVSAGFSRSGGKNTTKLELDDANFLGTGKNLAVEQRSTVDRDSSLIRYRDHNLMGSRARLELWYADNSDGGFKVFDLRRPFYALDTKWAAGLRVRLEEKVDDLYEAGRIKGSFRHDQDFIEAFVGRSAGLKNGRVARWLLGATRLEDDFGKAVRETEPFRIPSDRTLSYPWVGFEWIRDDFAKVSNLDQLARTEDVALGFQFNGRVGYSTESLGGDRNRAIFSFAATDGVRLGRDSLLLLKGSSAGRYSDDGAENFLTSADLRLYWRNFGNHLLFTSLQLDAARQLDFDNQLLLGGDSGLRGYPLRFQEGDRRVLWTLEQRFYTRLDLFKLVQVGGAVFVDLGRAWYVRDPGFKVRNDGWLRDVGLGLRLSSNRSSQGTVLHLDIAFPLDGDGTIDTVQWLVKTKQSF